MSEMAEQSDSSSHRDSAARVFLRRLDIVSLSMATSLSPGIVTLVVQQFSLKHLTPQYQNSMSRSYRLIHCGRDKVPSSLMERCPSAKSNFPRLG